MVERHRHPEHASRAAVDDLRQQVEQLRGQVQAMNEELRVMSVLQASARLLLGFPPRPPLPEDGDK